MSAHGEVEPSAQAVAAGATNDDKSSPLVFKFPVLSPVAAAYLLFRDFVVVLEVSRGILTMV